MVFRKQSNFRKFATDFKRHGNILTGLPLVRLMNRKNLKHFRIPIVLLLVLALSGFNRVKGQGQPMNLPTYDYAPYHFGFVLAVNQMNFALKLNDNVSLITLDSAMSPDFFADSVRIMSIGSKPTLGFTIGIVSNLRLGKYFDLRFVPSLAFGERRLNYTFLRYKDNVVSTVEFEKNITSTYVEFPLHIKYKSKRLNNVRAYVLAGGKYVIDLATTKADKDEEKNNTLVKLNRNDFLLEAGVGFDFYNGWFKFGTEIKMAYGLTDILKREANIYTEGIESIRSQIFQISFTFE